MFKLTTLDGIKIVFSIETLHIDENYAISLRKTLNMLYSAAQFQS